MSAEHLFDVEMTDSLTEGESVIVQTIWGDIECSVVGFERHDGFPMVKVRRQGRIHDVFLTDRARVRSVGLEPRLEGL